MHREASKRVGVGMNRMVGGRRSVSRKLSGCTTRTCCVVVAMATCVMGGSLLYEGPFSRTEGGCLYDIPPRVPQSSVGVSRQSGNEGAYRRDRTDEMRPPGGTRDEGLGRPDAMQEEVRAHYVRSSERGND